MKNKKDEYLKFIKENVNSLTNKQIAEALNISTSYVNTLKRKNNIASKISYEINEIQNQIILSGLLGDGNLKKNGKYNYYYRECHSIKESDYLHWKFEQLKPLTNNCSITYQEPRRPTQNPQETFNTKTLKELIPYSKMSKSEIILNLNELGLLLYILDDGWKHEHNTKISSYNICLAVHSLSIEENALLKKQYKNILGIESNLICSDLNTLSFPKTENEKFIEIINKYKMSELDVVIKKF